MVLYTECEKKACSPGCWPTVYAYMRVHGSLLACSNCQQNQDRKKLHLDESETRDEMILFASWTPNLKEKLKIISLVVKLDLNKK